MNDIPSCLKVWDYPGANQIMNSEQLEVPSENVTTAQNSSDSDTQSVKEQKVQVVDKVFMMDTSLIMCHCAIDTHFYLFFLFKKISRNKQCSCGSKKKYKACCGSGVGRTSAVTIRCFFLIISYRLIPIN